MFLGLVLLNIEQGFANRTSFVVSERNLVSRTLKYECRTLHVGGNFADRTDKVHKRGQPLSVGTEAIVMY